ncbi:transglycosylase SLT domain-containing protein [Candidatus Microgenomates bacterium]|nr:transglycosylase SLT domain-containing protein [Candidatus Microgenomates bacterium]
MSKLIIGGVIVSSLFVINLIKGSKAANNPSINNQPTPTVQITLEYIVITETPVPSPTRKPTPTFTPTPTRIPLTSEELERYFSKYADEYKVDKEKLRKIAYCESKFNPQAVNRDYAGLYQFSSGTWLATRVIMGHNSDLNLRFTPEEAVRTAAFKISRGGISSWPNCFK